MLHKTGPKQTAFIYQHRSYKTIPYGIVCVCIRTLCDNLRRERDRAVSDLADALRNLDDLRKQKNEAVRELKELK